MKKIFFISLGIFIFIPAISYGSLASDFTVNNQPTYSVPPGTSQLLILDLILPEAQDGGVEQLESIKIHNAGTAQNSDISKIEIFEDGPSAGWDGDETQAASVITFPFWDTVISGDFSPSQQRIFIMVDISSTAASGRTIQPELLAGTGDEGACQFIATSSQAIGPTDENVTGPERTILTGASHPTTPLPPLPKTPEAISDSVIYWRFMDLSNNEFGFRIKDGFLNTVAEKEEADLSYIAEIGLEANTEYSGRRVYTFNDRGVSGASSIFPEVTTLVATPSIMQVSVTQSSIEVLTKNTPSHLTSGSTGIYFENMSTGESSGWIQKNTWEFSGLSMGTEYEFRVKARNRDGVETPWSETAVLETLGGEEEVEEEIPEEEVTEEEEEEGELTNEVLIAELKEKIAEIQRQIIELLNQLIQLIQQQITGL